MKYERFEQLPVWQAAIDLAHGVYQLVEDRSFARKGDLVSQLQRAALSISNNIAEGFERGSTNDLLTFLYIARGSAGEVRSMLHFCDGVATLSDLKSQISDLRSKAESISHQLRAWADSLQNSDIRGQRYLTDAARRETDQKRRAAAFWQQLEDIQARARTGKTPGGYEDPARDAGLSAGKSA